MKSYKDMNKTELLEFVKNNPQLQITEDQQKLSKAELIKVIDSKLEEATVTVETTEEAEKTTEESTKEENVEKAFKALADKDAEIARLQAKLAAQETHPSDEESTEGVEIEGAVLKVNHKVKPIKYVEKVKDDKSLQTFKALVAEENLIPVKRVIGNHIVTQMYDRDTKTYTDKITSIEKFDRKRDK